MEEKNNNLKIIAVSILAIVILCVIFVLLVFVKIFVDHTDKKNFNTDIVFVKGVIEYFVGDSNTAVDDFTFLIERNRHKVSSYEYRGKSEVKLGLYERAIDDFDSALLLRPTYAYIYKIRSYAKKANGDGSGAFLDYQIYLIKKRVKVNISHNSGISNFEQSKFNRYKINNVDFSLYMKDLQSKIKLNWHPPKADRSKRVVVLFKIDRLGNLKHIKLLKSSGSKSADNAAVSAVFKSNPFKHLPLGYVGNDIDIQFVFDYNVWKKVN